MTTERDPQSAECPSCSSNNVVILAGGHTSCGDCGKVLVEKPATRDEPAYYEEAPASGAVNVGRGA